MEFIVLCFTNVNLPTYLKMNHFKIGLIERDVSFANNLILDLHKFGYELTPLANDYERAIKIIEEEKPHLLLLNFNLNGTKNGIELARYVNEYHSIPIIFFADQLDGNTIERSKEVNPNAILEKPFTSIEVFASIELALLSHESKLDYMLVKDGYSYIRVSLKRILFIDSERNYLNLHLTTGRKVIIRSTMCDLMERLKGKEFIRINRGCIININHVAKIETDKVYVDEHHFSISKQLRNQLIEAIEKNAPR